MIELHYSPGASRREPPILADGLTKIFRGGGHGNERVHALDSLTLEAHGGEILGIVGPCGAGKSTLFKIFLGILRPTAGRAWIAGKPVSDPSSRRTVGYLPEHPVFPSHLSPLDVLRISGILAGLRGKMLTSRIEEVLSLFEISHDARTPISSHANGIMRRLSLAQMLIHDPEILLLDEAGDDLDPAGQRMLRNILVEFRACGKTIVLTSRLLDDIRLLADRIAVLDRGILLRAGTPDEIAPALGGYVVTLCDGVDAGANILHRYPFRIDPNGQSFITVSSRAELLDLIRILADLNVVPERINPRGCSLEDAYLSLIGRLPG
ncbi:MAG TPA: ABC transporter ATP-binding protein [Bacteroidota bacterium]|nr:ABC transporter ATP-binding protein [Bacteroidota bacterium]